MTDSDVLEQHASVRGLKRKAATVASGAVTATGTAGTAIAAGLLLKTADDASYQTTAAAVIDDAGQASVEIAAVTAGSAGNLSFGLTLTWQSPPGGVNSTALAGAIVGGTDAETDASLLARLLDLIRRPPAGGNKYDYRRWALEVDGVTAAYVYPLRRGLGTVDIVITSNADLPSDDTIAATQAHIDDQRPVTAKNALVLAPSLSLLDHHILISPASGYTLATATPLVVAAVSAYFADLAPGDGYVRSQLEKRISDLACITDRQIVSPASNVTPTIDASVVEWLRTGAITVGLL